MKHFDDVHEEFEPKRLHRFASAREIRPPQALSERIKMDIIPRAAYDKSLNYKPSPNYYENAENEAPVRHYQQPKKDIYNIVREDVKKRSHLPNAAEEMINKKLDGNLAMGRDGWNCNKLENIQNRIQSVLKQVNK